MTPFLEGQGISARAKPFKMFTIRPPSTMSGSPLWSGRRSALDHFGSALWR